MMQWRQRSHLLTYARCMSSRVGSFLSRAERSGFKSKAWFANVIIDGKHLACPWFCKAALFFTEVALLFVLQQCLEALVKGSEPQPASSVETWY